MFSELPQPSRDGPSSSGAPFRVDFARRTGKESELASISSPVLNPFTNHDSATGGLVALNFAKIALQLETQGNLSRVPDTLAKLHTREIIDEIMAISAEWPEYSHSKVEDIHLIPAFNETLKLLSFGHVPPGRFEVLLEESRRIETSAVLVITWPAGIVACLKLGTPKSTVLFVVFNSRPHPSHPQGADISLSTSVTYTLRDLKQAHESQGGTQDLEPFAYHIFVAKAHCDPNAPWAQDRVKAEFQRMGGENNALRSHTERFRSEVSAQASYTSGSVPPPTGRSRRGTNVNAVAGPSQLPSSHRSRRPDDTFPPVAGPSRLPDVGVERRVGGASAPSTIDFDFELAVSLQNDDLHLDGLHLDDLHIDDLHLDVLRINDLQIGDYDLQDRAELLLRTFTCGICMDEHPEHNVAWVNQCSHSICRDCLTDFVVSKIQERQFPILCPICTANPATRANPAEISRSLVEMLDVTEEQLNTLTGMELAPFTVQVLCRKCKHHGLLDRQDWTELSKIKCPRCKHEWCKKCDHTIARGGPPHSCDGSSELRELMKHMGWKACPQCMTPIQRTTGCDHITCIVPGCNTHFCYLCGEMIARAPPSQQVEPEVMAHNVRCRRNRPPRSDETDHAPFIPPLPTVEHVTNPGPHMALQPPEAPTRTLTMATRDGRGNVVRIPRRAISRRNRPPRSDERDHTPFIPPLPTLETVEEVTNAGPYMALQPPEAPTLTRATRDGRGRVAHIPGLPPPGSYDPQAPGEYWQMVAAHVLSRDNRNPRSERM